MRTSKRARSLILCIGLAGLFLAGMAWTLRRPSAPLDHAHAVAQTAVWLPEFGNPTGPPVYYWTAGNMLTYFGAGTDGKPHLFQIPGGKWDAPVREGPAVNVRGGYAGQLSPDGKWFVEWHQNKQRQHTPTFVAMEDGRRIAGQPSWAIQGLWVPGNSHEMLCAVWNGNPEMDAYRPDGTPMRKIALPGVSRFYEPQGMDAKGGLIGFKNSAYFMNFVDGKTTLKQNYPLMTMMRVDMAHPDRLAEEWNTRIPEGGDLGSCLLSPSGDRLLWNVRGDLTSPILQKLRAHLPKLGLKPKPGYRWLVSGLKGENMHEIAAYATPNGRRAGQMAPYSSPRWMPDSRHISFIHQCVLFVRPVD